MNGVAAAWVQRLRDLSNGDGLRAHIARATGAAVILKILSFILGLATTVILARALGPDSLGVYAFALAVVTIVGMPASAGVPQLVTRETAKGQGSGLWGMTKGVWRWATRLVLLVSAVILLIAAGLGLLFPGYLRTESGTTLAIGLLMVPFMGLALVRASSLRGLGYTVQGQLPELAIKPLVFLALLLIFLLLSNGRLSAPHAMTLNIVATFAAFIVGALLLQRARPPGLANATPAYESRAWLATILPMASINAMHLINTQADILLIGIFMENADVGQYKVAAQISLVVAFGLQATKMIVEPHFARLYSQGNYSKLEKLARGASRFNITIALFVFSPLVLFGADLLHIAFGAAFVGAFLPMLILSAGRLAGSSLGTAGSILVMAGYHREYSRFWMIAVVLNVGLNLVLIPTLGLIGAAIATAFTLLIPYYLGWWGAKKWLGVDCFPFATRK